MKKINLLPLTVAAFGLSTVFAYSYPADDNQEINWRIGKDVSVSVNIPGANGTRHHDSHPRRPRPRLPLSWIDIYPGQPIPGNAVIGGSEPSNPNLFVCRANYNGGVHPGKMVGDRCNISWGGREIVMDRYQVMVSAYPLNWVRANFGGIPGDAIPGGYENGKTLYICQASYMGGIHPGKIVDRNCDIAYGGKEIPVPNYNVLVG